MQISKINLGFKIQNNRKGKFKSADSASKSPATSKNFEFMPQNAGIKINFTSKFTPEEERTAEFVISALEIAAASRRAEIQNPQDTPGFFNINLKSFLSKYGIVKQMSDGFLDKLSKIRRYKRALNMLEAGINSDYEQIALLNYTKPARKIPAAVIDPALYNCRYIKSVQDDDLRVFHIYENIDGKQRAYITEGPNREILALTTSEITPAGEKMNSAFYFKADGSLKGYEEMQEDGAIRTLSFRDERIITSEYTASKKLKSRKIFTFENGNFKEL